MIQSDKLAYLTDLSGSRGRTSGETALSAHSEEHEVFGAMGVLNSYVFFILRYRFLKTNVVSLVQKEGRRSQ